MEHMWARWNSQHSQSFHQTYSAMPISLLPGKARENLNYGGKLILPPSSLDRLSKLDVEYPLLFELKSGEKTTHAGVLEFIAEEGKCYMPKWMMETLGIKSGNFVTLTSTSLPLGSFIQIQPSLPFLQISDPKAVLENELRNFSALTNGDVFEILYNDQVYRIKVTQTKPANAISVVETDISVDFLTPEGYEEPSYKTKQINKVDAGQGTMAKRIGFGQEDKEKGKEWAGGARLGGPSKGKEKQSEDKVTGKAASTSEVIAVPNASKYEIRPLELPFGQLFFGYKVIGVKDENEDNGANHFESAGMSIKQSKKKRKSNDDVIEID